MIPKVPSGWRVELPHPAEISFATWAWLELARRSSAPGEPDYVPSGQAWSKDPTGRTLIHGATCPLCCGLGFKIDLGGACHSTCVTCEGVGRL